MCTYSDCSDWYTVWGNRLSMTIVKYVFHTNIPIQYPKFLLEASKYPLC